MAHTVFQSVADPVGMGDALIDLGLAAQRAGDIDQSVSAHEAYCIFEKLSDGSKMGDACMA